MASPVPLIDIAGRRITDRDLERAMNINILAGSLGMIWLAMTFVMPLTMFMEAIGASGVLIGLITTVRLVGMAVQIPAALVSERFVSRKKFWAPLAIVHRCLWFVIAVFAYLWSPEKWWVPLAVVAMVGLSDLLGNAGAASWFSWMVDLIPDRQSGRFWGRRQSIITAFSLCGMALAGRLLDLTRTPHSSTAAAHGFGLVFGIAAAIGVVDIVVHLWVKEPRAAVAERHLPIVQRVLTPLKNRDFLRLTLALAAWNFGAALITTFSVVVLKRDFHATYSQLAWIAIAASLGSVATSSVFGALVDHIGARVFCAMLFIAAPLTSFVWFFMTDANLTIAIPGLGAFQFTQGILLQYVAGFFTGSVFSAIGITQMRLVALLSQATGRTTAMAVHWSVIGLLAGLGPVAGGAIMDWFANHPVRFVFPGGTHFSFFHLLVLIFAVLVWCVALPLLLSIRTPVAEMPLGEALARMFLTNPLQTARNLQQIDAVSASMSSFEPTAADDEAGDRASSAAP